MQVAIPANKIVSHIVWFMALVHILRIFLLSKVYKPVSRNIFEKCRAIYSVHLGLNFICELLNYTAVYFSQIFHIQPKAKALTLHENVVTKIIGDM